MSKAIGIMFAMCSVLTALIALIENEQKVFWLIASLLLYMIASKEIEIK